MFGIGHLPELVLILVLALIFVGPGKLPAVGAALGKSIAQFKRATTDVEEDIRTSLDKSSQTRREVRAETTTQQHYLSPEREQPAEHVTVTETVDRTTAPR